MEWFFILPGVVAILTVLNTQREVGSMRRDVARVDRKLELILKHLNISQEESTGLSDRVRDLARDPSRKIEAIKAYRDETGAGLAAAKEAVEAFTESLPR